MARLPLVCKGCGQPLNVPETSTEPEPKPELPKPAPKPEPPKSVVSPPPPVPAVAPVPAPVPKPAAPAVAADDARRSPDAPSANGPPAAGKRDCEAAEAVERAGRDVFLFEEPAPLAEVDLEVTERPPLVANPRPPLRAVKPAPALTSAPTPAPAPEPPPRGGRKLLGVVVDVMVGL